MSDALLEVRHASKQFGALRALHDVSLSVARGEIVAVIGPNGAGKSTLLDAVAGRSALSSGSVVFAGTSLRGKPAFAVARLGIARTFQIAEPFRDATVLEAAQAGALWRARGPSRLVQSRALARESLARVGLAHREAQLGERLDVAERKRLQLAQALATQPSLLLLDELMAGLPPGEIDAFVRLVRGLCDEGITLLVVEHVMRAIAALADRVVVLHHGEKIAEDPPEAIFRDPAVLRAYLGPRFGADIPR